MSSNETLLLVGHGSKLPYSKELLVEIAEKIKAKGEFENIEIGLMEFNEPSIPTALKKIIAAGSKKIIVVPVFLAPGTHTTKDIPTILGLLKEDHGHCHHGHEHHNHDEHDDHDEKDITVLGLLKEDHGHSHGHGHHGHGHHGHHHHGEPVDIPDDVEIIYKEPLGADDRIVEIVMERALSN